MTKSDPAPQCFTHLTRIDLKEIVHDSVYMCPRLLQACREAEFFGNQANLVNEHTDVSPPIFVHLLVNGHKNSDACPEKRKVAPHCRGSRSSIVATNALQGVHFAREGTSAFVKREKLALCEAVAARRIQGKFRRRVAPSVQRLKGLLAKGLSFPPRNNVQVPGLGISAGWRTQRSCNNFLNKVPWHLRWQERACRDSIPNGVLQK